MRQSSVAKKLTAVLCALLLFTGSPFVARAENPWVIGEPLSSFRMGSAGILTGRNIIVSVFADSMYLRFTDEARATALKRLAAACGYLEDEAKESGVALELICDWCEYPDLRYDTRVFFPIDDTDDTTRRLENRVGYWAHYKTDFDELLAKYHADGIFMCVHFMEEGRSYALCYDGYDIPEESLILYSDSNASTCAHEMLHLFGAHDFYRGAEYTDDCVEYLSSCYPDEIMMETQEKQFYIITKQISPVTAYHIGWLDRIPDTEEYPQLKR